MQKSVQKRNVASSFFKTECNKLILSAALSDNTKYLYAFDNFVSQIYGLLFTLSGMEEVFLCLLCFFAKTLFLISLLVHGERRSS